MLTKASAITSEVRTDTRAEVGERCRSVRGSANTIAILGLTCLILAATGRAQGIVAWGDNSSGQCNVPVLPNGLTYVEIAAGGSHTVARLSDGSVIAWGGCGQCNVPALPSGLTYVEIAAGYWHTVARRSDGSVVAWGANDFGQCNVPPLPSGVTYVEIAAGAAHTAARLSDGSVWEWGSNYSGQCNVPVPPLPSGLTYVEIATGGSLDYDYYSGFVMAHYTVARRSDGSVVAWGTNHFCQYNNVPPLPSGSGLTYVEIAAGANYTVARRSDGAVVVSSVVTAPPSGLTYVEVAVGGAHIMARLSDGSVVAWGNNQFGQCNVPTLPAGLAYAEVAAGGYFDSYYLTSYGGHTVARYGPAATVVSVGTGCGGAGMPVFSCDAPRIGQNVTFSLTQGTPNASGFLYYSGVPAAPIGLGSGCTVEVDLATFSTLLPVAADATGAWSVTSGPVDPGLGVGLQVALQIALSSTPGPLGFDVSNGLIVTVGY